jgi:hypothetical protein
MRVFISWSGPRSRKVAEFLFGWLRKLPLAVSPWVSKEAINPGTRWEKELSEALEETRFGILCLTPENQLEPWICFEAGALAKTIEKTHVIPYLIDMKPQDLIHPLKQFQATEATKEDTWKMIKNIHKASGDETRSESDLSEAFEMWWPRLQEQIESAKEEVPEVGLKKEANLSEIKDSLDNVLVILESLSSRIVRWESQGLQIAPALRLSDLPKFESKTISLSEALTGAKGKGLSDLILEMASEKLREELKAKTVIELYKKAFKELKEHDEPK